MNSYTISLLHIYITYQKVAGSERSTALVQRLDTLVDGSNTVGQVFPTLAILTTRNNETSLLDHVSPLGLAGESLDTLNKILVAVSVSSNDLADQRNGGKTPSLVDEIENRVVDLAELEAGKDTTRLQDTECLLQRNILVCKVSDTKRDGVQIHTVVGNHVQVFSICLYEVESSGAVVVGSGSALAAFGKHVRIDIRDCDVCVWVVVYVCRVVEHAEGDVSSTACNI